MITISRAAAEIAAYQAAVQLGVLDRIDREPASAEEIAAGCGISSRGARALLRALASIALVSRDGSGRYRPAAAGLASLHPVVEPWRHLADVVRSGTPAQGSDTPDGAARHYPATVAHLDGITPGAAARVARLLPAAQRILDVGAGAAPWSLALAARDPRCTVTALDLAAVLPATTRAVQQADRTTQFDYLAGDAFTVELAPSSYGLIVIGHLCHLFDAAANRALIARLTPALRPAGTIAIIDVPPGATRSHALYELSLVLRTRGGGLHPLPDYTAWLTEAGLSVASPIALEGEIPLALITGTS